ncbi:uncharacterized protein LOC116787570 [Chiroxiphia lanceolata]|uniref:uncharacterized protein LOC116787570 n=1 Tax=Chiroxiphia lanceolata TaxID=296741 RepID=UPI0013CEC54F|nr:uncharacterized protein LOC116787570 [Chiroxiphia lanceolata]
MGLHCCEAVGEERRDRSGSSRQEPRRRRAAAASSSRGSTTEGPAPSSGWDCIAVKPWEKKEETGVDLRGKSQEEDEQQQHRAQEWTFEARAKKKKKSSSSVELKREHDRDPLGKGPSLAPPGQGSVRVRRAPSGCPGWLCAGRPPCNQGWVFALLCWPLAMVLLWLPGERGNPVRRVRAPISAPEGRNGALPTPGPPCKQGRAFPDPQPTL